jgi:hypothetical protein
VRVEPLPLYVTVNALLAADGADGVARTMLEGEPATNR